MQWPAKYFKPEEVLSPDGLQQYAQGNLLLQVESLLKYDAFREFVKIPVICNFGRYRLRAYRSPRENGKTKNSAIFSRHMQGIAFDSHSNKMSAADLFQEAKEFGWPCALYYPDKNFVHLDNRSLISEPIYKVM